MLPQPNRSSHVGLSLTVEFNCDDPLARYLLLFVFVLSHVDFPYTGPARGPLCETLASVTETLDPCGDVTAFVLAVPLRTVVFTGLDLLAQEDPSNYFGEPVDPLMVPGYRDVVSGSVFGEGRGGMQPRRGCEGRRHREDIGTVDVGRREVFGIPRQGQIFL